MFWKMEEMIWKMIHMRTKIYTLEIAGRKSNTSYAAKG